MLDLRPRWFPVILVLSAAALLVRLGHAPLFDPDEARFARTSVEMARSGDLVVPTFEGKPRLQKPPFLHWAQGALFATFGPGESLARLPSALATLLSLFLVGVAGRRRFGEEAAAWGVAVLGSMPLVFLMGRSGMTDALLAAHVFAAVMLDLAPPGRTGRGRPLLFGVLLGMAFLVKGPVGILLPVAVVLAGRTASGREVWPGWRSLALALATTAAVIAPWGLALLDRVGWTTIRATLDTEVAGRIAGGGAGHPKPAWYYGAAFLAVTLPWGLPALVAAGKAVARGSAPESRTARYAAAGLAAGIVVLSLSRGKVVSYLLPLLPLSALLVVREVGDSLRASARRTLSPVLVAITLVAEAAAVATRGPGTVEESWRWLPWAMTAVLAAGAAATTVSWILRRPRGAWAAAAAAQAGALLLVAWFPPQELLDRRSTASLVRASPELAGPAPLVMAVDPHPSLSFYSGRIPEFVSGPAIAERRGRGDDALWVFELDDWEGLEEGVRSGFRVIRRRGYYLLAVPEP